LRQIIFYHDISLVIVLLFQANNFNVQSTKKERSFPPTKNRGWPSAEAYPLASKTSRRLSVKNYAERGFFSN
jgi:hypothetical protein